MYYSLKKISVHYIISRNKPLVLTSGFHGMTDLMSAPLMMAVNFRIPSMIATVYFPQRNVSAIVVLAKAPSWSFHHVFKAVLTDNPAEWNTWDWQALNKLNLSVPLPHHNSWWASAAFPDAASHTMLQFWRIFHPTHSDTCVHMSWQCPLATGWHMSLFYTAVFR